MVTAATTSVRSALAACWTAQSLRERVLSLGFAWLMLGMLVMPAGISLNPGKAFQLTLIALLYLPALMLVLTRAAFVRDCLWPQPLFKVLLLLLGWSLLSLVWVDLPRPADELGRVLSPVLFVLAWSAWSAPDARRSALLLPLVGYGMALCALYFSVSFLLHYQPDARVDGHGVVANANYAAAVMGIACVWMVQLPAPSRGWVVARCAAVAALLGFVLLSGTRSVWLALAVCLVLAPLWQRRRVAGALSLLILLGVLADLLFVPDPLGARGMSLRPQIFAHALEMIRAHPWLGLGQGAPFRFEVAGEQVTHSHNVFTQAAIELGLPGLALVLVFWGLIGWQGWRWRAQAQGRLVLAMWLFASVVLQFDMPQLLDSPRPGWLLIWLTCALALGLGVPGARPASRA